MGGNLAKIISYTIRFLEVYGCCLTASLFSLFFLPFILQNYNLIEASEITITYLIIIQ